MRSHVRTAAGVCALAGTPWSLLGLGAVALAAGFVVRIVRWWMMLGALEPAVSLRACTRPFLLSLAVNNTMPLRAGDVVSAVGLREALRPRSFVTTAALVTLLVLVLSPSALKSAHRRRRAAERSTA